MNIQVDQALFDIRKYNLEIITKQSKDSTCLISGKVGSGKSNFALTLGLIDSILNDREFDLRKNVIYFPNYDAIKDKILNLPEQEPIVIDEAIRSSYKMNSVTSDSKKLKILLDICRKQKKNLYFCLPKIRDFTSLSIDRIAMWFHIVYRDEHKGIVCLFMAGGNFLDKTSWNFDIMSKKLTSIEKSNGMSLVLNSTAKAHKYLSKLDNYICSFEFYSLPKPFFEEYEKIAKEQIMIMAEDEENLGMRENKYESILINLIGSMYYEENRTMQEIKDKVNLSHGSINNYLAKYRDVNDITPEKHEEIVKLHYSNRKK